MIDRFPRVQECPSLHGDAGCDHRVLGGREGVPVSRPIQLLGNSPWYSNQFPIIVFSTKVTLYTSKNIDNTVDLFDWSIF